MLEHLEIKNFALIDNLSVDFSSGFNVITGETGAGKSIILGALGLLMGEKADASSIRTGSDEMVVNAVISIPEDHEIRQWLKEKEIEVEDDMIIVKRSVKSNGRSVISVQGQLITRNELVHIADSLVDMHGQSEHQSLLSSDKQKKVVDYYAQNGELLEKCSSVYSEITELETDLEQMEKDASEYEKQREWLTFALNEIEAAEIKENEEEELKGRIAVLGNYESIFENISSGIQSLKQIKTVFYDCNSCINNAAKCDSKLASLAERLESCQIEAYDVEQELSGYISDIDYSEDALNALQSRLSLLQKLKRKYGSSIEEVLGFAQEARKKLELTENSQRLIEECKTKIQDKRKNYEEISSKLSKSRHEASEKLEKKIEEVLRTLGMPNAEFSISITDSGKMTSTGSDNVSFMICANPGENLRQMREIASGGELSRVMLALKTVLAKADSIQTQVFDEIDTGIGGAVALSLAECICDLAVQKQVIVITHLASIASKASRHFSVTKTVENGRTFTRLRVIEGEDRVCEIARMLSGDNDSVTLEHARNLLA